MKRKITIAIGLVVAAFGGFQVGMFTIPFIPIEGKYDRPALLSSIRMSETGSNYEFSDIPSFDGNGLTSMTLAEILAVQEVELRGTGRTSVGAYALSNSTLRRLMDKYEISSDRVFSSELQTELANMLVHECAAGASGSDDFQRCLDFTWSTLNPRTFASYSLRPDQIQQ